MRNILILTIILFFHADCRRNASDIKEIRVWRVEDGKYETTSYRNDTIKKESVLSLRNGFTISKKEFDSIVLPNLNHEKDVRHRNFSIQKIASKNLKLDQSDIKITKCYIFTDSSNYDFGSLIFYSAEYGILIEKILLERQIYKLEKLNLISDGFLKDFDTRKLVNLILSDSILNPPPPSLAD
jgi:hypothetical protein